MKTKSSTNKTQKTNQIHRTLNQGWIAVLIMTIAGMFMMQSCKKENKSISSVKSFNYDMYEMRESLFTILEQSNVENQKSVLTRDKKFENTLNNLSIHFDEVLVRNEFDDYQIQNPNATLYNYLENSFITPLNYELITMFLNQLNTNDFAESINILEQEILNKQLNEQQFNRYNFLVNTLMVTNDFYQNKGIDIFQTNNNLIRAQISAGCAVAIASNAISTYGLTSCFVPGPNCWIAIAGKGLALAGIWLSCA